MLTWALLMIVILLTNGMSAFGLKMLAAWGVGPTVKFPYLTLWYAAGFACIGFPMLAKGIRAGVREMIWGAVLAALSIGGQIAMADALSSGTPADIVFPVAIGGSIIVVAVAGRVFFGEKLHPLSWTGVGAGIVAVVLISIT
ncbi:MAG: hypothetical protein ACRDHZ_17445 [Ktedonobacteraceae bacterium]